MVIRCSNARGLFLVGELEIPHASGKANQPAKHKASNIVKKSINTLRKVDIKKS